MFLRLTTYSGTAQMIFGIGDAETEAAQAHTRNDAFNKLATVLRCLCSEGERLRQHVRARPSLLSRRCISPNCLCSLHICQRRD